VPEYDDRALFEKLILDGFQAGLSWLTILRKRDGFRKAFSNFEPEKIARYRPDKITRLMADARIIRNRAKIEATLGNARAYLQLCAKGVRFDSFLWQFTEGRPLVNHWRTLGQVPAETSESRAMSKALKEAGFRFVGPTICYAFMQAVGMVDDHLAGCFRRTGRSHSRYTGGTGYFIG
jgi:DNA-3-methyladenine glycosylase I